MTTLLESCCKKLLHAAPPIAAAEHLTPSDDSDVEIVEGPICGDIEEPPTALRAPRYVNRGAVPDVDVASAPPENDHDLAFDNEADLEDDGVEVDPPAGRLASRRRAFQPARRLATPDANYGVASDDAADVMDDKAQSVDDALIASDPDRDNRSVDEGESEYVEEDDCEVRTPVGTPYASDGNVRDDDIDDTDQQFGGLVYPTDHVYYEDVIALGRDVSQDENPFVCASSKVQVHGDGDGAIDRSSATSAAPPTGTHVYLKPLGASQWERRQDADKHHEQQARSPGSKAVADLRRKREYNTAYSYDLQDPVLRSDYRQADAPLRRNVETLYWAAAPDMPVPDPRSFIWFLSMVAGARPEVVRALRAGTQFLQSGFYVNPSRIDVSNLSIPNGGNGTVRIANPAKAGLPKEGAPYNACLVTIGIVKKDELDGSHASGIPGEGVSHQKRITIHPLSQEWQLAVSCLGEVVHSDKLYGYFGESDVIIVSRKSTYKGKGNSTAPGPVTPGRWALFGSAPKPVDNPPPLIRGPPDALLYTDDVPVYDATGNPRASPPLPYFLFKHNHFCRLHEYPLYRKGRSVEIPPYDDTKKNLVTNEDITSFSIVAVGYTSQIWSKNFGNKDKKDANTGDGRPNANLYVQWVIVFAHQVINGVPPVVSQEGDFEREDDPWPLKAETLKRISLAAAARAESLAAATSPSGPKRLQPPNAKLRPAASQTPQAHPQPSLSPSTPTPSTPSRRRNPQAVPSKAPTPSSSKPAAGVGTRTASGNAPQASSSSRPSSSRAAARGPDTPSPTKSSRLSSSHGPTIPTPVRRPPSPIVWDKTEPPSPVWDLSD
ncbi:hypothetical protein HGRIS_008952 [Hohenbuehelia grisea]|uniref:Uncharacterized protein n=1 Tax=Hohenbuehelia grisea TaxID=104357 RepID=A0ABR3J032_9AGAR